MKTIFAAVMVNAFTLFAATAAHAEADLPLTPAFAGAVSDYRDCVLGGLDRSSFAQPDRMAAVAMAACEKAHDAARAQLTADLSAAQPGVSRETAKARANAGMAKIDPMIAAAALGQARAMVGAAAVTDAPSLARSGVVG